MRGSGSRTWLAIVALTLTLMAVGLDMTVLNLALPTLATSLHASTGQLEWFIDAYSLVVAAALLPGGLLGDRFGRKKVMLISLVLFGLGSLSCAYASSADMLIAARAVLGLGAAALLPLALSVLPVLFTEEERPKAIALLMVGNMVSFPIGPILGGWLLTNYWWGTVFLINVPIVVIAIVAIALLLPESRGAVRRKLDLPGLLSSSAGLVALTYAVIRSGERGWGDGVTLLTLFAGFLLLTGFTLWERRVEHALIDLSLFRSRSFTWGSLLATVVSFAMFGILFGVPQYFQSVMGTNALGSGLRLLPIIGGLLVGAPTAARLGTRLGAKVLVAIGFSILTVGLMVASSTSVHSGAGFTSTWLVVIGLGLGFALPSSTDSAIGALPVERSGVGSALMMAFRQVGGTIGVAVLGSILSSEYRHHLNFAGLPAAVATPVRQGVSAGVAVAAKIHSTPLLSSVRSAFVHGLDAMLWVCAGIAFIGIILALAFLPRRTTAADKGAT